MKSSLLWTAALAASVMTMACTGTVEPGAPAQADARNPDSPPGGDPPPDAPADANEGDPVVADAAVDAGDDFFVCREPVTENLATGRHNAGRNCMECHSAAGPGPRWYAAGTVFVDGAGSAPRPGVTITIQDATGKRIDLVTARNGNFWTPEPLEYPLFTFASSCPSLQSMGPEVPASSLGACNSCHGSSVARINL
jgi:hypothetical protein